MYEAFFQLEKRAFSLTADPAFLFLTHQHCEALAGLTYAILARKGFVVLTGDAGTGKTTLLAKALHQLPKSQLHSSVILNPTLTRSEFLELALLDFGVPEVPASKAQRLWLLQDLLLRSRRENKAVALIVDEAHKLSPQVLEEIRLLGNFESADEKLLQIVLLGQPELAALLNEETLRQFKQRIAVRLSIQPLSRVEVHEYIVYRWTKAGGRSAPPFDAEAMGAIAQASGGVPRLINSICDNALLTAFAEGVSTVTLDHVLSALSDLDINVDRGSPLHGRSPMISAVEDQPVMVRERAPVQASMQAKQSLLDRWSGKLGLPHRNGRL